MNNIKKLLALKASRPDAYKALHTIAFSHSFWSEKGTYQAKVKDLCLMYKLLKMNVLGQDAPYFMKAFLIGCHDRSKNSLAFKQLDKRQIRKWESKQVA